MSRALARRAAVVDPTPDDELFAQIATGDLAPLGELFDRYHATVRHFLLRATGDAAEADDLVQETFLTASRAAESFERGAPGRPFLIGVAAQLVRRRRRGFARFRAMIEALGRAPRAPSPTPEDGAEEAAREAALQAALAKLSEDRRLVLTMVELGGMSGVEVARALGIPPGTVWRRLSEARTELARRLTRGRP